MKRLRGHVRAHDWQVMFIRAHEKRTITHEMHERLVVACEWLVVVLEGMCCA